MLEEHRFKRMKSKIYLWTREELLSLTSFTSSKLSSYWPPSSPAILSLRIFRCFLKLRLATPGRVLTESRLSCPESMNEVLSSKDPGAFKVCFLPIEFLCKTRSPPVLRFILVVGSASKHRHGQVCESTTDEPTTDKAPTILSSSHTPTTSYELEDHPCDGNTQIKLTAPKAKYLLVKFNQFKDTQLENVKILLVGFQETRRLESPVKDSCTNKKELGKLKKKKKKKRFFT